MSVLIHQRRPAAHSAATSSAVAPGFDQARESLEEEEVDEIEDTQPSFVLPEPDEDFWDAPTVPGFRVAGGAVEREFVSPTAAADGQWDKVLRAVAVAVKRVFASHSIHRVS